MADTNLELTAHLLRRAGASPSWPRVEEQAARPYVDVVEDLLHPERFPDLDDDLLFRYFPALVNADTPYIWSGRWIWRMAHTQRPLQEKIALFWHHVFATAWFKSEHTATMVEQVEMFRREGLGNLRDILLHLSRDPAMIYWLDNCENHAAAPNENYGRELLELFSMGLGNYSETDVKMAGRAFTGWTFEQPIPLYPYGLYPARFVYRAEDHDASDKPFLGQSGPLNGEDVIDIIVRQEATARFIARHLYNFFVADEPPVSAWSVTAPQDPDAIDTIVAAYRESDGDIRAILRTLFNSEFFKEARFRRVKCPAEFIAGVLALSGSLETPAPGLAGVGPASALMGQALMDPPSVEGWHTGKEWIDGGTLTERVNYAVAQVRDPSRPGVKALVDRLGASGGTLTPPAVVEACLDYAGTARAGEETIRTLLQAAEAEGEFTFDEGERAAASAKRVAHLLSLVVASPEYQFA